LSGNVFEWTLSAWSEKFRYPEENNPEGDISRVVRGSSWRYHQLGARSAARYAGDPQDRLDDNGFRVVCSTSALLL
jgi:formylglycine-generating enzyme required for sulfatase activity